MLRCDGCDREDRKWLRAELEKLKAEARKLGAPASALLGKIRDLQERLVWS